ncbi:MAG: polyphosphate kinase 1 [Acidobacteriaceae bacterium]|nr:polyphosphate kinase 1 [Acidobacteriaceae bacterium]
MATATASMASIGELGVLNVSLPEDLEEIWIDRDLSWLDFNERVLAEALDERVPLLERAKFLAIFTSNLDEFFMKRMAVLRESDSKGQRALREALREKLLPMLDRQAECYRDVIKPGLAKHGIFLRYWHELTPRQQEEASQYFDSHVSPALMPLVIDPVHPFPFISNLSTSLVFRVHDPAKGERMFARVKVPEVLKYWVSLTADVEPAEKLLVPLYEVIHGNLDKLYSGMEISEITIMRLTRDAEVELDEEHATDYRALVKEEIRKRRYEPVVRLEFRPGADPEVREFLRERFKLDEIDLYDMRERINYIPLFELMALPLPKLKDPEWTPLAPAFLPKSPGAIFGAMQATDFLAHHPYDSFDATVERFISAAADDPHTVAIKMTAYRVGDDTPFVKSLIRAAERGKQVACVMEIKARFDEERNLHWAAELERVGAHVTFGVPGLKTHAKAALVVRKEGDGLRCYAHIGTGNYHVKTARLYADCGLFTCDPRLTNGVVNLFHYLTGHSDRPHCSTLLVAPLTMRPKLLDLVHRETKHKKAGKYARIVAKMNQLEDPEMIEALCEASNAGVETDLIVRGFCCLRPGVPGHSENIRIRSIIGRFLEHSRIFYFANGHHDPGKGEFFIGSADWMYRNLSKRIEVVTPVFDSNLKHRLGEILDINLRDKRQAWVLGPDGKYTQLRPEEGEAGPEAVGTHQTLMNLALDRASA